jgi:uncharacterized membrane protein
MAFTIRHERSLKAMERTLKLVTLKDRFKDGKITEEEYMLKRRMLES